MYSIDSWCNGVSFRNRQNYRIQNRHIKVFVYGCPRKKADTQQLITDILKYYPLSEIFNPDEFMDIESDEIVLEYLESCYRSGRINTVIKRYIKEGVL